VAQPPRGIGCPKTGTALSASESVQLRACRAVLADQMAVFKFSDLEYRMAEIEEQLSGRTAVVRCITFRGFKTEFKTPPLSEGFATSCSAMSRMDNPLSLEQNEQTRSGSRSCGPSALPLPFIGGRVS
jgi:hypothetical protein